MGLLRGLIVRLRALVRRRRADHELDDEIAFHLEQEVAKLRRTGLAEAEARRKALALFGGVTQTREAHRDVRGASGIDALRGDVRFAFRVIRRSPALSVAAILTIGIAIGANTAIFSAVNAVIIQPLPFPAANRLYMLWESNPERGWRLAQVAPANMLDWSEQVAAFSGVAGYSEFDHGTLTGEGEPVILQGNAVTGNFFSVLGVRPLLGRGFRDDETWTNGTPVMVLSHRLWQERFRGDSAVVGRSVMLDGRLTRIVGVMPRSFVFPNEKVLFWQPMEWLPANRAQVFFRRAHWIRAVARLRTGATEAEAGAQLQTVVRRLQQQYPETNRLMGAGMTPLHAFLVGDTKLALVVLLGAVTLLLLIACANVGNLLLVKATERRREAALRLALGARPSRLVRQALTESLVVSMLGGVAGILLGLAGTRALVALLPDGLLPVSRIGADARVLGYVFAITTACGLVFGIAPALWTRRRLPAEALKEGGRSDTGGRRARRLTETLVVVEVCLALTLTIGAGLLTRSLLRLQQVNPGFEPRNVLATTITLSGSRYDSVAQLVRAFDGILHDARGLPGAQDAAAITALPLTAPAWSSDFHILGHPPDDFGTEVVHRETVGDYFRVMRVPVIEGRTFTPDDDQRRQPRVAIINDVLARKFFHGQDPIGQQLVFDRVPDSTSVWRTIVGVVGSEHQGGLGSDARIEIFTPMVQEPRARMSILVRTTTDPTAIEPAMRRLIAEQDPDLPVESMRTMTAVRAESMGRERFLTTLLLGFAGVGMVLAVIGVYGVVAQLARRRTREIGIRIALGADAGHVRWLVVRHGLTLLAYGVGAGTLVAWLSARVMRSLLFGVTPADPLTFITVPVVLALTVVAATWLPAAQASRLAPAATLREE